MAASELDSFYRKFKSLLVAGHNATLTLEGVAGEATVTLKASLGVVRPSSNGNNFGQHRSPSYFRRQQRRKKLFASQTAEQACEGETSSAAEVADVVESITSNDTAHIEAEEATVKQTSSRPLQAVRDVEDNSCSTQDQKLAEAAKTVTLKSHATTSDLSRKSFRNRPTPRPNPECCNHDGFPEPDAPDGKCCWHRCGRVPWPWQETFKT